MACHDGADAAAHGVDDLAAIDRGRARRRPEALSSSGGGQGSVAVVCGSAADGSTSAGAGDGQHDRQTDTLRPRSASYLPP